MPVPLHAMMFARQLVNLLAQLAFELACLNQAAPYNFVKERLCLVLRFQQGLRNGIHRIHLTQLRAYRSINLAS